MLHPARLAMNLKRPFRGLNALVLLSLLVLCFPLVPRLEGAQVETSGNTMLVLDSFQPVLSDFDRDKTIDHAILRYSGARKTIHVARGGSSWTSLSFDSNTPDRGNLVSGDIDHDGDADLIWISYSADQFVAWLGDGRGNFRPSTDPRISLDAVLALQWHFNRNAVERGDGTDSAALPAFLNWIVRRVMRGDPDLVSENFRFLSNAEFPRPFDAAAVKLRGPPTPISTN